MINKIICKLKKISENDVIIYKNVIGAFIVKGVALFVTLYTLPSYINFFNNDEVLGVWFTVLSLLNWVLNFDLGIGNGLRNYLSVSISQNNKSDTKKYISSAYFSVGGIVLLLSIIFPILIMNSNLNSFFNINENIISQNQLYIAIIIVFIGVMIQFWLKLINSVLYAMQNSFVNNFLVLCTNVIILFATIYLPSYDNNMNIIIMALIHAIAVALPLLITTVYIFCTSLKDQRPNLKYVTLTHVKSVLSLGGIFFFIQIAYMVIMSTNEFLIAKCTNNFFVVDYQIYYKLFSLGSTLFALSLTPLWSVVTKAKAEKNYNWIKQTYKKFMRFSYLFCIGEILLIFIMQPIMDIWLGNNTTELSYFIAVIFSAQACLMIVNSVLSSIANGIGELKIQAICFGLGAVLKIPLSFAMVRIIGSWGGVVIANVICMGIYSIIQPFYIERYFEKTMKI
ncbi:MAG: polysaccharide biosynthesis C-terminal domain-containing protein [Bacilli bacterium]